MNALYPQDWPRYLDILAVFLRFLGLFLFVPGFSHQAIPANMKVLLALSLSLALYPVVQPHLVPLDLTLTGLGVMVLRESAIGCLMGFAGYMTFEAINLGAQFAGYQMGFGVSNLMDPHNQSQASVLVVLQGWLALMVFFIADMHHGMLRLFVASFEATRHMHDNALMNPELVKYVVGLGTQLFSLAVQMAAPFTLLILASQIAIGVLARMLPQMNVLLFSFPITISVGLGGLYILAPDMLGAMDLSLGNVAGDVMTLLRQL